MKDELPPIQRWLNRLLALPIGLQNRIFDEFLALVETRVAAAREAGTLDVGVETITVDTRHASSTTRCSAPTRVSGATSHLLTIEIERRRNARVARADPPHRRRRMPRTMLPDVNAKSGKVAVQTRARAGMERGRRADPARRTACGPDPQGIYAGGGPVRDPPGTQSIEPRFAGELWPKRSREALEHGRHRDDPARDRATAADLVLAALATIWS